MFINYLQLWQSGGVHRCKAFCFTSPRLCDFWRRGGRGRGEKEGKAARARERGEGQERGEKRGGEGGYREGVTASNYRTEREAPPAVARTSGSAQGSGKG